MMAAFIIAIRGTVGQAILLGLSATLSHTAVVWAVTLLGMYFGRNWNVEVTEPYFQVGSAVLIIGVAAWMLRCTWKNQKAADGYDHDHGYDHSHYHPHDESKLVDTGHGKVRLDVFQDDAPPRFRLYRESGHVWQAGEVRIETERPDGRRQAFTFVQRDGFVESEHEISEPHEFVARLSLGHANHSHDYELKFVEHDHAHHAVADYKVLDVPAPGYQDPHELAHANEIRRRFAGRNVTTVQIVMFGITGGLVPCPASITVLLLCLQLKKITLGMSLVLCFSIGLALTMVVSGVMAAVSVKHVSNRWSGFGEYARKAPYFSGVLILMVGLYVEYSGLHTLGMV